jgi:putative transposase
MVRAGVVTHPSEWPFCGYNEIQEPKRKNVLIDYQRLTELLGFDTYDEVRIYHKRWVDDYLENKRNTREEKWTESIAVGSEAFIEKVKSLMRVLAIGRKSIKAGDSYQLREPAAPYLTHFGRKKDDIGPENTYLWDINL